MANFIGSDTKSTQRQEADNFFKKQQQKMEHYGDGSAYKQAVNRDGVNEKIRDAQKQARKAIEWKLKDNQRRGRTYNDGQNF